MPDLTALLLNLKMDQSSSPSELRTFLAGNANRVSVDKFLQQCYGIGGSFKVTFRLANPVENDDEELKADLLRGCQNIMDHLRTGPAILSFEMGRHFNIEV